MAEPTFAIKNNINRISPNFKRIMFKIKFKFTKTTGETNHKFQEINIFRNQKIY